MASWAPIAAFRTQRAAARPNRPRTARTPLTIRAAKFLARKLPRWQDVRTAILATTGFAWISLAAWWWHPIAGAAAIGVSLLLLEALSGSDRR